MERFRWLIESAAPKTLPWDIDLTPAEAFATVPSRGAIVEDWLLTLPRQKVINIASLGTEQRKKLLVQAAGTAIKKPDNKVFFFEHGPTQDHSLSGCGVDYAHLHSVPLAFNLIDMLPNNVTWRRVSSIDPWENLGSLDYLVIGTGDTWLACEPNFPESQFFRKLIANKTTSGYGWDHNKEFWSENVKRTVTHFSY